MLNRGADCIEGNGHDDTHADQQLEELIQMILSDEVEGVTIIGQSLDENILDPLTEAKKFAKAMGFETLTTIEKQNDTNTIHWVVQSIGTAEKGGCKDGDEN